MGFYVPDTLRKIDNWILWRLEPKGQGKPDKVPYSPKGGKAKTNDRRTWGSYEEAITALENGDFSGLGFVFSRADGLVFIDLDSCITPDGEETQLAKDIQALFPGSYAEISQSETGLHIVCKGILPQAVNNRKMGVEMYSWGRFMAFTGNATSPTEPQIAQEGINTLYRQLKPHTDPPEAPQRPRIANRAQSTDEIQEIILSGRQGEKFARLLAGDWTGYSSQSEADQAFIAIANAFCADDKSILELWGRSELSKRKKGQRPDYVARMIKNAQETYTGGRTSNRGRRRNMVDVVKAPARYRGK